MFRHFLTVNQRPPSTSHQHWAVRRRHHSLIWSLRPGPGVCLAFSAPGGSGPWTRLRVKRNRFQRRMQLTPSPVNYTYRATPGRARCLLPWFSSSSRLRSARSSIPAFRQGCLQRPWTLCGDFFGYRRRSTDELDQGGFCVFSDRGFGWSGGCWDEDGLAKIKEYLRLKVFIPPWRDHAHIPRREGWSATWEPALIPYPENSTQAPHLCMYILRVSFFPSISQTFTYITDIKLCRAVYVYLSVASSTQWAVFMLYSIRGLYSKTRTHAPLELERRGVANRLFRIVISL